MIRSKFLSVGHLLEARGRGNRDAAARLHGLGTPATGQVLGVTKLHYAGRTVAKRGQKDAARELLAAIYGRFTEGVDTKDLKDAKTLLSDLEAAR